MLSPKGGYGGCVTQLYKPNIVWVGTRFNHNIVWLAAFRTPANCDFMLVTLTSVLY
jgi:NAD-dependent SIR2 family protein deacetylase